jgi:raffinose/stachyose/melibiose transport system permease protein
MILLSAFTILLLSAFPWIRFSHGRRAFDETFSLYNVLDRLDGTHFNFALWDAGMLDFLRTLFVILPVAMLLSVVILIFALIKHKKETRLMAIVSYAGMGLTLSVPIVFIVFVLILRQSSEALNSTGITAFPYIAAVIIVFTIVVYTMVLKGVKLTHRAETLILIWLFLIPGLSFFVLYYLVPIITLIITGFTVWDGFNPPQWRGIGNYLVLFESQRFLRALSNLGIWAAVAATLHAGFSLLIALYIFRKPFGGRFVRAVYMIPNVIAIAAWGMIFRFFFQGEFGILNGLIRLFVPDFAVNWFFESPYAMIAIILTWLFYGVIGTLIILGDLNAIPGDLHEAAKIDGASPWRITTMINIPLSRISIGTTVILSISARISMFEVIEFTTRGGPGVPGDTQSLSILLVNSISNNQFGFANAIGTVMLIIGIVMLVAVNRIFRMNDSVY